jgi:hypothetical protein
MNSLNSRLLQEPNPFLFLLRLAARTFRRLEGSRSVLEKLFLPAVEHRRLQAQFFTQIGNWDLSQKLLAESVSTTRHRGRRTMTRNSAEVFEVRIGEEPNILETSSREERISVEPSSTPKLSAVPSRNGYNTPRVVPSCTP